MLEEYFEENSIIEINKVVRICSYISPIWKELLVQNKDLMVFEVASTLSNLSKFNTTFECYDSEITELIKCLKEIQSFSDDNSEMLSEEGEIVFAIYLYETLIFEIRISN